MDMAHLVAQRSHCRKQAVGCVLTDLEGGRIAIGYNGLVKDTGNDCGVDFGPCGCIHAEANALLKVRWEGPILGYCTHAPCQTCAAMLVNAGLVHLTWSSGDTAKGRLGLDIIPNSKRV